LTRVSEEFYEMKAYCRFAFFLSVVSALLAVNVNGQAGGGSLSSEPVGGAALIFRKPENPKVDPAGGAARAGGGRIPSRVRTTPAKVVQDKIIAKANAARSAPTPRYSEAEQQYKLAAQQDPTDERGFAGLGNVYLDQGLFNEAVGAYQQALKVKADYVPAYQPLGYALARLNRHTEAADTLKQALQYDPDNAEIYNNLAYTYVHAERYGEAVEAGQQAITLLGKTGEAYKQGRQNRNEVLSHSYKNLGNAYNGLKQYNEAADALKRAAEIEPNNAAAHFNLGLALYNGRRYSEAIEAYKAVLKLRPQLAAGHYNLGLAYVAINDKAAAREQYNILKPLNPAMASQLQGLIR
ncbi:MAG: tetratricopeptide repeat protein, partial [Acidobacteriota bacterium]|nr:tetratricopeptide repeat protein [Acidobacteriota bacterium]